MRKTLALIAASAMLLTTACSDSGDSSADDLAEPEVNNPIVETSFATEKSMEPAELSNATLIR